MRSILFFIFFSLGYVLYAQDISVMTLAEAVETGLKNNCLLEFEQKHISIASKNMHAGYRKFFPELNLGYSTVDSVVYYGADTHQRQITTGITQLIYDKGVLAGDLRLQKEQSNLDRVNNELSKEKFICTVISDFQTVLELTQELEITESTRKIVSQQVDIAGLERDIGEITELDFLEMELHKADIDIQIAQINENLTAACSQLALDLNISSEVPVKAIGKLNYDYPGFVLDDEDFYYSCFMNDNAELKEKYFQKHKADIAYKILKKNFLSDIYLSADLSVYGNEFPLKHRSFAVSLNLDFDTPGLPSSLKAGGEKIDENQRQREFAFDADILGNTENLFSRTNGRLEKEEADWNLHKYMRENKVKIKSMIKEIQILKENLNLARNRIVLEGKKLICRL